MRNVRHSIIELTLTDDFALADVVLAGTNQVPILQPGEVLQLGLLLDFNQGVAGTHPFTMTFQAEGPVSGGGREFSDYWNPPTGFYGQPVYGGTLRINSEDPLQHGNVWGAISGAAVRQRAPTMSKLVDVNPYNSDEIIPDLANGWQFHTDLQGITLHFPADIQWHNGETYTCEDARFSLQTMVTGNGLTSSAMMTKLSFVDGGSITCADDFTLNLRFHAPDTTALEVFTNRGAFVFNKAWFVAGGEEVMFQDLSVGTGPFRWAAGQSVGVDAQRFERNPSYFKGDGELPYLDNLVIYGIVDESRQQAAMLAHQTDWHWVRNFGQYRAYVDHDQIMTVVRPSRGHHSVWLNKRNVPFDNGRVRQAIFMAIDRQAAVQVLQDGHGSLGFLIPPNTFWTLEDAIGCTIPA